MSKSRLARGLQLLADIKFRGNRRQEVSAPHAPCDAPGQLSLKQLLGWGFFLTPVSGLSFKVLEGAGMQRCPLEQQEAEVGGGMQTEEQGICGQASSSPPLRY